MKQSSSSQSEVGLCYVMIHQVLVSSGILFPEEWWVSVEDCLLIYYCDYVLCPSLLLFMPRIRLIDLITLSQLCRLASLELRPFNHFVWSFSICREFSLQVLHWGILHLCSSVIPVFASSFFTESSWGFDVRLMNHRMNLNIVSVLWSGGLEAYQCFMPHWPGKG